MFFCSARYCFVENLYNGGNMTDAEYTVLSEWFNFLITCPQLNFKIDQIVYLRTDPEVAYERIKKRKRPEEHLIPFAYLQGTFNQFKQVFIFNDNGLLVCSNDY